MTLRIVESGTSLCGPIAASAADDTATGEGAADAAAAAGAAAADDFLALPPARAASTSCLTMRPPGPEPAILPRSRLLCSAMRRASGDANTRAPCGAAAAAATGACAAAGAAATGAAAASAATGAAPLAATALASSPSPAITAINSLTFTPSVPPGTTIFASTPSSTASTSIVALSVSISHRTWPDLTVSPSAFSQRAILPSVMVGDRAGISTLVGIFGSPSRARRQFL